MNKIIYILLLTFMSAFTFGAEQKVQQIKAFAWDNPIKSDGTPVGDDFVNVRLYMSNTSGNYILHSDNATNNNQIAIISQNPQRNEQYVVDNSINFESGETYYFVVTAGYLDTNNVVIESNKSEELIVNVDRDAPTFPKNLRELFKLLTSEIVILPLNEGTGVIANDISGLNNNGILTNGAIFENVSGDGSSHSVRFDGVDDYIDIGNVDVNGSGITLACWFFADDFSVVDRRFISKATGTASDEHVFMLSTINSGSYIRLRGRLKVSGSTTTIVANSGNLIPNRWYHSVLTYDGSQLILYLDGVEVGSMPLNGSIDTDPGVSVAIGAQPPGAGNRFFKGLIDDVRILQRALTSNEIQSLVQ